VILDDGLILKDNYQLKVPNDPQNKTFSAKEPTEESLKPFFDHLFAYIKDHFENGFRKFVSGESKQIPGFHQKTISELEEPKSG